MLKFKNKFFITASLAVVLITIIGTTVVYLTRPTCACGQDMPKNQDWTLIGTSDELQYYRMPTAERQTNGNFIVREKSVFRTDTEKGRKAQQKVTENTTPALEGEKVNLVSYYQGSIEIDCKSEKYKQRENGLYDADGKPVEVLKDGADESWKNVSKGSTREQILNEVCEKQ